MPKSNKEMPYFFNHLTKKQRKFCECVVWECLDYSKSARKAGYADNGNIAAIASAILKSKYVQEYIEYLQSIDYDDGVASTQEILTFFTDVIKDVDSSMKDRIAAADRLAKTKGLFVEKIEQNLKTEISIIPPKKPDSED